MRVALGKSRADLGPAQECIGREEAGFFRRGGGVSGRTLPPPMVVHGRWRPSKNFVALLVHWGAMSCQPQTLEGEEGRGRGSRGGPPLLLLRCTAVLTHHRAWWFPVCTAAASGKRWGGGGALLKGGDYARVTQPLASCLCLPPNHLQPPLQPPVTAPNRFVSHRQPPLQLPLGPPEPPPLSKGLWGGGGGESKLCPSASSPTHVTLCWSMAQRCAKRIMAVSSVLHRLLSISVTVVPGWRTTPTFQPPTPCPCPSPSSTSGSSSCCCCCCRFTGLVGPLDLLVAFQAGTVYKGWGAS